MTPISEHVAWSYDCLLIIFARCGVSSSIEIVEDDLALAYFASGRLLEAEEVLPALVRCCARHSHIQNRIQL